METTSEEVLGTEVGLALSGGGFRATLFTLGSLCRLNDLGYLRKLDRISSVSGGSITSGYLGFRWKDLQFDADGKAVNFSAVIVEPLRKFCRRSVDGPSIGKGLLTPWKSIGDYVAAQYDEQLFRKPDGSSATLQDLPAKGDGPHFILCATSLQTRACVRFSRSYIGDYNLGLLPDPTIKLSIAVGASSAFPPVLSPVILKTDPAKWQDTPDNPPPGLDTLRGKMILSDGGVYDNLGFEPLWKRCSTLLACDAGAPADIKDSPHSNWLGQLWRANGIMMEQTRALRRRMLLTELRSQRRQGTFWGIGTRIDDYLLPTAMIKDSPATHALRDIRTRLNPFNDAEQKALIHWGYALCDAAMRAHITPGAPAGSFPVLA